MGYQQDTLIARGIAFVEAATVKHRGYYGYDKVAEDFVNSKEPVRIDCPEHGEFRQAPQDHRRGQRCAHCSGRRHTTPEARRSHFIRRASTVHGDRYSYDDTTFVDQRTPVVIRCTVHGPFDQRPKNHLEGEHCPSCAATVRRVNAAEASNGGRYGTAERTRLEARKKRAARAAEKQAAASAEN